MLDRIEQLVTMFEQRQIDRRQLIGALLVGSAGSLAHAQTGAPAFQGRMLNHVTLNVTDMKRSRAFYEGLVGASNMLARGQQPTGVFDLRIGDSFITVSGQGKTPPGINHFCVGIEQFDADRALAQVQKLYPASEARAFTNELAGDKSVMLKDPDGISVQLGDVKYQLAVSPTGGPRG